LGTTKIKASRIGLGCMGMTSFYKSVEMQDEALMIDLIGKAV